MTEQNTIETILNMSAAYKVPATELVIEYLHYKEIGLKDNVAIQYLDLRYKEAKNV